MEQGKELLGIGQNFTDETTGIKNVPIYHKDRKTGLMSTTLVQVGQDSGIIERNNSENTDIQTAIQDITSQKGENIQQAQEHYREQIRGSYGNMAVDKFDKMIAEQSL